MISWVLLGVALRAGAGAAAAPAAASPAPGPAAFSVSIEPPPGWREVDRAADDPGVLAALRGPEMSAFILNRTDPVNLTNRAAMRAFLLDVLAEINKRTGQRYAPRANLLTLTFKNELTAHYIIAEPAAGPGAAREKDRRPKMAIALTEFGGVTMVGTLTSAVPESLLSPILGSVKVGSKPRRAGRRGGGLAVSDDGQFAVKLDEGIETIALGARERARGFVLALSGFGSELRFLKVPESAQSSREESQTLRAAALSLPGMVADSLSPVASVPTPVGPALLYLSAQTQDPQGARSRMVVGFLPWSYWGYSVFARGPSAVGLLKLTAAGIRLGPSGDERLVAATPRLSAARQDRRGPLLVALAVLLSMGALAFIFRKR